MNSLFRLDAASWSPVESLIGSGSETAKRRGPSLIVAIAIIGGVALVTAGSVAAFFVEPSEGAPEAAVTASVSTAKTVEPQAPVKVASVDAMTALPVHKVLTRSFKAPEEPTTATPAPAAAFSADAGQADVDELGEQDPRWARSNAAAAQGTAVVPTAAPANDESAPSIVPPDQPAQSNNDTDTTETAAIAPDEVKPKRAAKTATAPATASAAPQNDALTPPGVTDQTRTVQITKGANMRSRPKSGSSVLGTVPKGAAVQMVGNCSSWCQIVYKGKRGYVFRDFIGGGKATAKAQPDDAKTIWNSASPKDGTESDKPRLKITRAELR